MIMVTKTAAFFDVDRTLLPGHTMERLFVRHLWRHGYLGIRALWRHILHAVSRSKRVATKRSWNEYKGYLRDLKPEELQPLAEQCFNECILPRISQTGRKKVQEHQKAGHFVVLLTGSLEPLARLLGDDLKADLVLAARLETENGAFTGCLANTRPYGDEKARLVRETASDNNLELKASFAYGDHHSDARVLEAVGNPQAVNPDLSLRKEALRRGWPMLKF